MNSPLHMIGLSICPLHFASYCHDATYNINLQSYAYCKGTNCKYAYIIASKMKFAFYVNVIFCCISLSLSLSLPLSFSLSLSTITSLPPFKVCFRQFFTSGFVIVLLISSVIHLNSFLLNHPLLIIVSVSIFLSFPIPPAPPPPSPIRSHFLPSYLIIIFNDTNLESFSKGEYIDIFHFYK